MTESASRTRGQHQVKIALHVTTLRDVLDEEGTIITALLHDVQEDYGVIEELERQLKSLKQPAEILA